jgi:hypothetical protein
MELTDWICNRLRVLFPNLKNYDIELISKFVIKRDDNEMLTDETLNNFTVAHARHRYTGYDDLMNSGEPQWKARQMVQKTVNDYMKFWSRSKQPR